MDWEVRLLEVDDWLSELLQSLQDFPETWKFNTTPGAVVEAIRKGLHQLWGVFDPSNVLRMLLISRIEGPPEQRVFVIWWGSGPGGLEALLQMGFMEDVAKKLGCRELQVAGRPGWARKLRDRGYELRYVVIGKTLEV